MKIIKIPFILIILLIWGIGCSPQQEEPSIRLHNYTKAQQQVIERWQNARKVQRNYGPSETENRAFMQDQLTNRFRQPLVWSPGRTEPTHGKK